MALTYSYSTTTSVGHVRLIIGDAPTDVGATLTGTARKTWPCVLADEEITNAINGRGGNEWEAASDLLLMIASNRSLLECAINVNGYSLDTKGLAKELRDQSAAILQQIENVPAESVVDLFADTFMTRNKLIRGIWPVTSDPP